jgi:Amt family ammonium transporter
MLAGATGCLTMLFFGLWYYGCWGLSLAMNGLLAGMVATCSGCNSYDVWVSTVVGFFGAFGYFCPDSLFENVLRIDDLVGASALHMGAGMVGLILPGFFVDTQFVGEDKDLRGVFYGGNGKQLGWQIAALFVYFCWAFGASSILFYTLKKRFDMLRVSREVELLGMDLGHHGASACPSQTMKKAIKVEDENVLEPVEESKVTARLPSQKKWKRAR